MKGQPFQTLDFENTLKLGEYVGGSKFLYGETAWCLEPQFPDFDPKRWRIAKEMVEKKMDKSCQACGLVGAGKFCGACKQTYYCDRYCQQLHWKFHKDLCKKE
jgi:hypothetical protein